jgi:hypothetical protein
LNENTDVLPEKLLRDELKVVREVAGKVPSIDVEKGPSYKPIEEEIPEDEEKRSIRLSRRLSDWSLNKGYPQVPVVEGVDHKATSEDLIKMGPNRRSSQQDIVAGRKTSSTITIARGNSFFGGSLDPSTSVYLHPSTPANAAIKKGYKKID